MSERMERIGILLAKLRKVANDDALVAELVALLWLEGQENVAARLPLAD